jgi:hypothetical protein
MNKLVLPLFQLGDIRLDMLVIEHCRPLLHFIHYLI